MSFFAELKRRNVLRVVAAYVVAAWLIVQVVETIFPAFGFGDAAIRAVVIAVAIGLLPIAVIAWAFEITPEGLKLEKDVDRSKSITPETGKTLDRFIMVILALALGYFAFDKFVLSESREASIAETARQEGRTEAIVESYGDKSIVVLPFADMSPGGDQAYFSDGISEELLNLLSRIKGLRVISRSSSFAIRDADLSAPQVAEKLNVAYVLEGSVRKAGDRVRITAQLIDARSDTHLWSDTYDRTLADVFAVQDQISRQVVDALKIRLLGATPASVSTNSAAYELYLKGRGEFAKGGQIHKSIELFEQVIANDEEYAPAYGSLALALIWSDEDYSTRDPRLEAAVNRALDLDADNSDALAALGQLRVEQNRIDEGRVLLERAIALNPSNAFANRWLGRSYGDADPVRYYALSRKAYALNPMDPSIHYHLANAASMLGRYEDALDATRELPPDTRDTMAGIIHHRFGYLDRSLKSFYQSYRTTGDFGTLPRELMMMEEYDLVEAWLREGSGVTDYAMANLAAMRGDKQEAFRLWGELAKADGALGDWTIGVAHIRFSGDFVAAREHLERFLGESGEAEPAFNPDRWLAFVEYALALQRTGSAERAAQLIDKIEAFIETRIATGAVRDRLDQSYQLLLSALHAMRGDNQSAITALRNAAGQGGLTCTFCVRMWPHWDKLRDDPEFNHVLAEAEADKARQRQHLADEGMLLTPQEVLQLEDLSFDPFVTSQQAGS